jgi:hypothetical protein
MAFSPVVFMRNPFGIVSARGSTGSIGDLRIKELQHLEHLEWLGAIYNVNVGRHSMQKVRLLHRGQFHILSPLEAAPYFIICAMKQLSRHNHTNACK